MGQPKFAAIERGVMGPGQNCVVKRVNLERIDHISWRKKKSCLVLGFGAMNHLQKSERYSIMIEH